MQRRKRGAPPFLRHFPRGWMEARNLHEGVKKEKSIPVPIKRRRKKKDGLSFSLSLKNLHYHSRPFSLELKGPPLFIFFSCGKNRQVMERVGTVTLVTHYLNITSP